MNILSFQYFYDVICDHCFRVVRIDAPFAQELGSKSSFTQKLGPKSGSFPRPVGQIVSTSFAQKLGS